MTAPKRIQLRRTKGWRKPAGAVVVARPAVWGNPFRVFGANEHLYCDASHRRTILTPWVIWDHVQGDRDEPATPALAVKMYRRWLMGEFASNPVVRPAGNLRDRLPELRGKDLCCYCKLGHPCHADVLLEMAN